MRNAETGVVWFVDRLFGHCFAFPFVETLPGVPSSRARIALDYKLAERAAEVADHQATAVNDWPAFARGVLARLTSGEVDTLMLGDDAYEENLRSTERAQAESQRIVDEGRRQREAVMAQRKRDDPTGEKARERTRAFLAKLDAAAAAQEAKRTEIQRVADEGRAKWRADAEGRREAWLAQRAHG